MAHPRGPSKVDFLKKMKNLIVAAYDGNIGENRCFTVQVTSDQCGDIEVKYHMCESEGSDDDVQLRDLGKQSVWKKTGETLSQKYVDFLAKHNVGVTLAQTEERLMAVINETILTYPDKEDLFFAPDDDMEGLKKKRCMESFSEERKRLKTRIGDENAFSAASAKAFSVGVKQPLKCDFMAGKKQKRVIEERAVAKSVYENTTTSEFAKILAKKVAPKFRVRRVPVESPETIEM